MDVCDAPLRATKGGADDVTGCLDAFEKRWAGLSRGAEVCVVVSPKRLLPSLPKAVRDLVIASVPPPGQWNAHRQAFLRDMGRVLEQEIGRSALADAAMQVDGDLAALEWETVQAGADGADKTELKRLLRGHPREAAIWAAWEQTE